MGKRLPRTNLAPSRFEKALLEQLSAPRKQSGPVSLTAKAPVSPPPSVAAPPVPAVTSKYLTAQEAQIYLNISKATFFRLKKQGVITSSKVTNRYHADDLDLAVRGKIVSNYNSQNN